jgi:cell division protein FtsL
VFVHSEEHFVYTRCLTSERIAPRDAMVWNKVHYILYHFKIFTKLEQVLLLVIMIVVAWLLQCMVQMPY